MLTIRSSGHGDRFHINVLCFCDGSAFMWGLFFMPGALIEKKVSHTTIESKDNINEYELFIYIRIGVRGTPRQGI